MAVQVRAYPQTVCKPNTPDRLACLRTHYSVCGDREAASAPESPIAAGLEREASASSRIAVPASAPGRVTEQGIDAGAGGGLTRRLVSRKTGNEGRPGSGSQDR